ncbi:hypothetical protein IFM89_012912 [Coptis chinensis]|uniref:Uncharacterized protein n=1 Tax=Coptis chinensis TaxID=261450 RepID=A0A835HH06_9MAGN|nr:hypothetical protein IFM89_012912 [Coptis chinensis]
MVVASLSYFPPSISSPSLKTPLLSLPFSTSHHFQPSSSWLQTTFAIYPSTNKLRCVTESTEERWRDGETLSSEGESDLDEWSDGVAVVNSKKSSVFATDSLSSGLREPVYEVVEVNADGVMSARRINRRQLLKSSGE